MIAWLFSEKRKEINLRVVFSGVCLQMALAFLLIKLPYCQKGFLWLHKAVYALEESTRAGTGFVFGYLGGADLPFAEQSPGASYILAFRGLPLVLVISAVSSLLFYWKIIPVVVRFFSWILRRVMGIGDVEGLGAAANIFVGMVESPLLIRPYLNGISRSELFAIMTCGMATIAGTVMVLYTSILGTVVPGIMGHLLTASIISAPAAVTISKVIVPETGEPSSGNIELHETAGSSIDAITKGTFSGVKLLINIIALLIVLVGLVHLMNILFSLLPDFYGEPVSFQRLMGWIMSPIVWLMGLPMSEAGTAGSLMGTKTVLNEFLAYFDLSQ